MVNFDYQKEIFKKLTSDIEKYKFLEKLRDILRNVQKLSWRITQFDKKFPLEATDKKDYKNLLNAYLEFGKEIENIAMLIRENDTRTNSQTFNKL